MKGTNSYLFIQVLRIHLVSDSGMRIGSLLPWSTSEYQKMVFDRSVFQCTATGSCTPSVVLTYVNPALLVASVREEEIFIV